MSFYPVKIPWTAKPPPGTPIDWSHPLAQGLVCAHDFTDGAGLPLDSALVKRNATSLSNVAYGVKNGELSVGSDNLSATSRAVELGQSSGMLTGSTPYTIIARVLPTYLGASNRYIFSFNTYDAAFGFSSANAPIIYDGGTKTFTGGSGPVADEWADVAWVRNSVNTGDTYFYKNGVSSGTAVTHSDSFPAITSARWLADSPTMTYRFYGWISYGRVYNRALSQAELQSLKLNPWQIYQPRTVWVPVAASGGGSVTVTDSGTALAESYAAVTDIATYIAAAEAIITAGASAAATVQMLEGLLTTAEAALTVDDRVTAADTVTADVAADATVQDVGTMQDSVYTEASVEASVIDSIVSGIAENLLASATAITSATDVQLMVDNLTIMAASGASISEIYTYLEQLTAAATSGASVTDVLVTQFVGRYLFVVTVPPREFITTVSPRSYLTTVGPR